MDHERKNGELDGQAPRQGAKQKRKRTVRTGRREKERVSDFLLPLILNTHYNSDRAVAKGDREQKKKGA